MFQVLKQFGRVKLEKGSGKLQGGDEARVIFTTVFFG